MKKAILEIFKNDRNDAFLIDVIWKMHHMIGSYPQKVSGYIGVADTTIFKMDFKKLGELSGSRLSDCQSTAINSISIALLKKKRQGDSRKVAAGKHPNIVSYRDLFVCFTGMASSGITETISLAYAIYLYERQKGEHQVHSLEFHRSIAMTLLAEHAGDYNKNGYICKLASRLQEEA